jgi:hypothetical protein
MAKVIQSGPGWRWGRHPEAGKFTGLIGTDDWAIELTTAEHADFLRLLAQLVTTMATMQAELMAEEAISLEAESPLLWLELEGLPLAYSLRLILHSERRVEAHWPVNAVAGLVAAIVASSNQTEEQDRGANETPIF